MKELLSLPFFQNALLISLLLGIIFGLLSFFVVLRRMVFIGAGIAHMAFGGVALGVLLGIQPFVTSLVFCLAASVIIHQMTRTGQVTYDTGIGVFFSFAMALGALFIALKKTYAFDLSGYLFGNILGVSGTDTLITAGVAILFLIFILVFLQKLLFISFDEQVARVNGIRVVHLDLLLLMALAAVIVASMKMVGIILVSALTVLPASFGMLLSRHYAWVILASILYSIAIMLGGLFLSYTLDTPTGATMVVLGTLIYFLVLLIKSLKYRK